MADDERDGSDGELCYRVEEGQTRPWPHGSLLTSALIAQSQPIARHGPRSSATVGARKTHGCILVSSFDSHRLHPPSLHHFRGDAESGSVLAISAQGSAVADLPQPGRHAVASRCAIQSMVPHLVFRDPHHTNEVRRVSQTLYHKHHIGDKFGCLGRCFPLVGMQVTYLPSGGNRTFHKIGRAHV